MTDDLNNRGPIDRSRINVEEKWERTWWCRKFGCTEQELRAAVRDAGPSAEAVGHYLRERQAENV
ncbi:MAG TPA: DUF3606 domain-containing protein [Solimonas sp.]|nr:DUF3606 domain-containing protein [Solimonas sp.]